MTKIVRRASLARRFVALLLTIAGVAFAAYGSKNYPNQMSVPLLIGIALVVAAIVVRMTKTKVES
jgi:hypothetical protein